ncbi:winged helix DNA-binding domain-containing protein [Rhodococcus yananensis]|uniref:winged helix DNA-binding domain-containing protein n=1 Tax=Rhodococcus yananensis TaxID=2879464 RepID=UPI003EBDE7D1
MTLRAIDATERSARLAVRHRLASGSRAADPVDAAASMVCLHGTDPASVYLSAWARVDDFGVPDLDAALYEDRTLVRHLSMRRTLFVFPREVLPYAQAGASIRVAAAQRRAVAKDVERAGIHVDGTRWLAEAGERVLEALADGREATSTELKTQIPMLDASIRYGEGRAWGGKVAFAPRVLTVLSASGRVLRASNRAGWRTARPTWTTTESWLGAPIDRVSESDGTRRLVALWLRTFGPGTEADVKWWLGTTVRAVRTAFAELGVVEVDLGGQIGYLLPDDADAVGAVEPWGALLPALDPTTMGWFDRDWYLGEYRPQLFDSTGNAGPTAWWDGRIVGTWWQDDAGEVILHLLEDVGSEGAAFLRGEAERLGAWLGGEKVLPRFPTPLSKQLKGSAGA